MKQYNSLKSLKNGRYYSLSTTSDRSTQKTIVISIGTHLFMAQNCVLAIYSFVVQHVKQSIVQRGNGFSLSIVYTIRWFIQSAAVVHFPYKFLHTLAVSVHFVCTIFNLKLSDSVTMPAYVTINLFHNFIL
jgi:hypothetical protein